MRDDKPGAWVQISGLLYLNPGEAKGHTLRKLPSSGDFVSRAELYRIVMDLCVAWHEATYTNCTPMRVLLPTGDGHFD